MNVHGMKKRRRAMKQCDERKSHVNVLIRLATNQSGQTLLQEFERRHVLLAGEGDSPISGDEAEVVGVGREEVEHAAANLRGIARGLDGRKEIEARAAAEQGEKIVLIGKAFIESWGSGARGAGDGAHREGVFAAFTPQAVGGIENAAFQTSISFARHAAALPPSIEQNYILYNVKITMYK